MSANYDIRPRLLLEGFCYCQEIEHPPGEVTDFLPQVTGRAENLLGRLVSF